jgi:hypothetical protein
MMKIYKNDENPSKTKEKMPSKSVLDTILAFSKSLEVLNTENKCSLSRSKPIEITLN